jgi:hypothetical protein
MQQHAPLPPPPPPHNSIAAHVTPAGAVHKQHRPPLFAVSLFVLYTVNVVYATDPAPAAGKSSNALKDIYSSPGGVGSVIFHGAVSFASPLLKVAGNALSAAL